MSHPRTTPLLIDVAFTRDGAQMPVNAYGNDAGWDLRVCEPVMVEPGQHQDVRSGVSVNIPVGWYGRIVGRSSAFRKRGVIVLEGIIDAGFTGELFTSAYNPGQEPVWLDAGEAIAQLIVQPVPAVQWRVVGRHAPTARGERGFGSSGR